MAAQLKIMSFNMRYDTPADGKNSFQNRRARIAEFLAEARADIIGFQEVTTAMRAWLVENLTDYYAVGVGREADYTGECALIAFRKDTMALMAAETVMLSLTPTVFGSRYDGTDQSACPRTYVRVLLKHRDIDEPFYMYNVHTDHKGQTARMLAVTQLLQDITSHDRKFFLSGDFNATPNAPEIQMITKCRTRNIVDATETIEASFHSFGTRVPPVKIDYIFADASVRITEAVCVEDHPAPGTTYISDHNPIYIIAEI